MNFQEAMWATSCLFIIGKAQTILSTAYTQSDSLGGSTDSIRSWI